MATNINDSIELYGQTMHLDEKEIQPKGPLTIEDIQLIALKNFRKDFEKYIFPLIETPNKDCVVIIEKEKES